MSVILQTGFSEIKFDDDFHQSTKIKAEKLIKSNHLMRVREIQKDTTIIEGFCIRQTNVTAVPYHVQLDLDENRNVIDMHCTCVVRYGKRCKHIYALLFYICNHRSTSKTSVEQEWGKPSVSQMSKTLYSKGKPCAELIPRKEEFKKDLGDIYKFTVEDFENINCPFKKIMILENRNKEEIERRSALKKLNEEKNIIEERERIKLCVTFFIESFRRSKLYGQSFDFVNEQHKLFYAKHVALNNDQIMSMCIRTKSQSDCTEWNDCRQLRITASQKAHRIKQRKKVTGQDLAFQFLEKKTTNIANFEYGLKKEKSALVAYETMFNVKVQSIGFFVAPLQSWLGVSVDGVVIKSGKITKILEIKCPVTCRNKVIVDEKSKQINVGYLEMKTGKLTLKTNNLYYTQCQLQLYCTGMTICDFFVWSPLGTCTVEVIRDECFLKNLLPLLTKFYFTYYLPELCDMFDKENYNVPNKNNLLMLCD